MKGNTSQNWITNNNDSSEKIRNDLYEFCVEK